MIWDSLPAQTPRTGENCGGGVWRQQCQAAPGQKGGSNQRNKWTAPGRCFLDRHDRGQYQHAGQMRDTDRKHDKHQSPAATQAVQSVADAEIPCRSGAPAIILSEKSKWMTTDSKSLFLESAELKSACD